MTLHKIIGLIVLYAFGPVFLASTNPETTPIVLLVVPFLWVFVVLFTTIWLLLGHSQMLSKGRRRLLLSGIAAVLPVLILVLNSIHQLTMGDILLVTAILGIISFYLSKADFIH